MELGPPANRGRVESGVRAGVYHAGINVHVVGCM